MGIFGFHLRMEEVYNKVFELASNLDLDDICLPLSKYVLSLGCLYLASKALGSVWRRIIGPLIVGEIKWRETGSWAVIAGASYGIGAEYARELASRGMNIVIIGQDEAGLRAVEMSIQKKFSVKVKIVVADFSDGMVGFNLVKQAIKDLDIGVLVNTAALDLPYGSFDEMDGGEMKKLIDVNCGTPTVMMSLVLPTMLKKRKGVIINFGSFVGEANCPYPTVYPSTKAFCHKLTRDLQVWYKDSGVIFQTVIPGVVDSPMAYNLPSSLLIPNPVTYTKSLIKTVGWVDETSGYIPHDLQFFTMKLLNTIFGDFSMIKYWPVYSKPQLTAKKTN